MGNVEIVHPETVLEALGARDGSNQTEVSHTSTSPCYDNHVLI